jgi:hypothetical protein
MEYPTIPSACRRRSLTAALVSAALAAPSPVRATPLDCESDCADGDFTLAGVPFTLVGAACDGLIDEVACGGARAPLAPGARLTLPCGLTFANGTAGGDRDPDLRTTCNVVVAAGPGVDGPRGGPCADLILTGAGGDKIKNLVGDDTVCAGNDYVKGREGGQTVFGGAGNDRLYGMRGRDRLVGGPGNDFLFGFEDRDTLEGGEGDDVLAGGAGPDIVDGGPGADTCSGGTGHDTLACGAGPDACLGARPGARCSTWTTRSR